MTEFEGLWKDAPVGSWGVILQDGMRFAYQDIPMSGELLKDNPTCPEWVKDAQQYWVRSTVGGFTILGPVLRVVK